MGRPHASWLQQVDQHLKEMGMGQASAWGMARRRSLEYRRKWMQQHAAPTHAPIPDLTIWLPNHATYNAICVNHCSSWISGHTFKVSPFNLFVHTPVHCSFLPMCIAITIPILVQTPPHATCSPLVSTSSFPCTHSPSS